MNFEAWGFLLVVYPESQANAKILLCFFRNTPEKDVQEILAIKSLEILG